VARRPVNDEVWLTFTTFPKRTDNPHVFPGRGAGGRLNNVSKAWRDALTLAGAKDCPFHGLRHCFVSFLVHDGVPLNRVRELMRHTCPATSLRYVHLPPEHQKEPLTRIGAISVRVSTAETEGGAGHARHKNEQVTEGSR
jgi:integrase